MKKLLTTLVFACLTPLAFADLPAKEGLWEYSTHVEIPGTPTQPMTHKICLTAKDLQEGPIPKDDKCQLNGYKVLGDTATWQIECQGEAKVSGEGKITFQNDTTYTGETRMHIETKGRPAMDVNQHFSAKRIGDCQK